MEFDAHDANAAEAAHAYVHCRTDDEGEEDAVGAVASRPRGRVRAGGLLDETGRLWDVLTMTRLAIRRGRGSGDRVTVELCRIP